MTGRRNVFLLAYEFPPIGGIASLRSAKFAKYLGEFGWNPIVFHAGKGHGLFEDESLLREVAGIERHAIRTFEGHALTNWMNFRGLRYLRMRLNTLFPIDRQIGWLPLLHRKLDRHIAAHGVPDVVFTTSSPFSSVIAGSYLQRRYGIPWVADFRDDWVTNALRRYPTRLHRHIASTWEQRTLTEAAAMTTVTPTWQAQYQKMRPSEKMPVQLILNGYDEEDFASKSEPRFSDKWTLGFVGSSYETTDPYPTFNALNELIEDGLIPANAVRAVHVGYGTISWPANSTFEICREGIRPHREAVQWMKRVNTLVFTCHRPQAASGRIYEHIRSGTPIVGTAPTGEATKLVADLQAGKVFPPEEREALKEHLVALYQEWKANPQKELVLTPEIQKLSRRHQTGKLAALFDEVAAGNTQS